MRKSSNVPMIGPTNVGIAQSADAGFVQRIASAATRLSSIVRTAIVGAQSRLAKKAFLKASRPQGAAFWLRLTRFLMPKALGYHADIGFSRKTIRRIVETFEPDQLKLQLSRLAGMAPGASWPAALAADCSAMEGYKEVAESILEEMRARGTCLSKQHLVQLAMLQSSGSAPRRALATLNDLDPSLSAQGDRCSLDVEACLIRANAHLDDDEQWASHVRTFYAGNGLPSPSIKLCPANWGNRFDLLGATRSSLPRNSNGPLVSIIVSCFNGERYIAAALQSLLQQTHANIEVLVVDDCSTDGSRALVEELARNDRRIRLLQNRRNVGTYVSRNRALRAARGIYVTTQDADDWSHPERIERQVRLLEEAGEARVACYCVSVRMSEEGRFELGRPGSLLKSMCYPSLMYRRTAALKMVGYWDCVRVEADAEYIARLILLYGKKVVIECPKPLMIQLRLDGSLTTSAATANIGAVGNDRRAYRSEIGRFHRRMTRQTGRFDFENWRRPFPAPDGVVVSAERVREVLTWE